MARDDDRIRDGALGEEAEGIAVIGLAGRFPGAPDVERFWENLAAGVGSVREHSDEELLAAGVPAAQLADPDYVKASGTLEDVELFDTAFFGYNAREASLLDPQQRLFLECSWEALENAACDPKRFGGPIGVYAGTSTNSYYVHYFLLPGKATAYHDLLGSDKDFLATRVSYKLGLTGPSLSVQTACSTSLVAVHLACQSLLSGESDLALAGGASIAVPHRRGYLYATGGIKSPDGRCRSYDARGRGTVSGNGVGVVVLRRLEDALADGDRIRAVIRASAINNDGDGKAGFTAPSIQGQTRVIADALALAGVEPASLGCVEGHGSATPLGDAIEVEALRRVFEGVEVGTCALGSVKSNIGHLDAAAGVAGLIKAVLALEHGQIPASLHFERPNPKLELETSPFFVPTTLVDWPRKDGPRRAGVSAFGLGGTNAHVVLEEAPAPPPAAPSRWSSSLLLISARTPEALEAATDRLAGRLRAAPDEDVPDLAFTTQVGRRAFPHRRALLAAGAGEAAAALAGRDPERLLEGVKRLAERPVAFLFPGLGEHHAGMAKGLYDRVPAFREPLDEIAEALEPHLGEDVRKALFARDARAAGGGAAGTDLRSMLGRGEPRGEAADPLARTRLAQPALFAVEAALARLWMAWGVQPRALLGYSLGEYTAAAAAGVMSWEDAAAVVARRAELIDGLPAGAMLAVPLAAAAVRERLGPDLSLSAVAGAELTVVAGPPAAIRDLAASLSEDGHLCRPLRTTHAFHSAMMTPIVEPFRRRLAEVELRPPEIPYLSNVTGEWTRAEEATDPGHWARHLVEPVRFAAAVGELWREPGRILLEVGPGQSLTSLALQHEACAHAEDALALPSLPSVHERGDDEAFLLRAGARLWLAGVDLDWRALHDGDARRRLPLPTYPFERRRCWVEEEPRAAAGAAAGLPPLPASQPASPAPGAARASGTSVHVRPGLATPYLAPRDEREEELAELWQELLGLDRVGVHDSFFELGGHSLLATQLAARLQERRGAELPIEKVFEAPTVAGLARLLASAAPPRTAPIPRRPASGPAPLAYAQQRLWVLDRLEPGLVAYNNPTVLELLGPLDVNALEAALRSVAERHEILRSRFSEVDGEPVQTVEELPAELLARREIEGVPLAAARREARGLLGEEVRRPFDLGSGRPFRALLVRLAAQEHLLAITLHHIVSDDWSNAILVRELAAFYEAAAGAGDAAVPELPIQYGDYARWERETLRGEALERHLGFWREHLDGAPTLADLPVDRPRPAERDFAGGYVPIRLDGAAAAALRRLARDEGGTLFMVLTAAYATLLARYGGGRDMVLGYSRGVRSRIELEPLIGCFATVLPLRVQPRLGTPFRRLVADVKASVTASYPHQDVPFEVLVRELGPERALSHNALFQTLLAVLNVPAKSAEVEGLRLSGVEVERRSALFDLSLFISDRADRELEGYLEYATDLFDATTGARLARHFRRLLAAVAAGADRPLAELPLLEPAADHQVRLEWNDTAWRGLPADAAGAFDLERPLSELLLARAAARPTAPAVVFDGEEGPTRLSYGELFRASTALAADLRRRGVGPETPVAVLAERSSELVVALTAVVLAGGAYVPLDPSYPEERLAFMLADSGAAVLLVQPRFAGRLPAGDAELVELSPPEWTPSGVRFTPPPLSPENGAYLIYTSGSTGRPKGALNSHRAIVNRLAWMQRSYPLGEGDRVLQKTPMSFDVSVWEFFWPLLAGAGLVVARPDGHRDPAYLVDLVARQAVTTLHFVPSMLEPFLAEPGVKRLRSLRRVIASGEALPAGLVRRFAERLPGVALENLYGPTEAAVDVTAWPARRAERDGLPFGTAPLGRPIAGVVLRLVGRGGRPRPIGAPGELLIGGAAPARGYHGRPATTAERFVPDPAAEFPGARLYRTGDLARYRADGTTDFLGRIDHQVKLRGFRVELGEIEARLVEHGAVRAAAVVIREDGGPRRLVAYWSGTGAAGEPELRAHLGARLPEYMVPAVFVELPDLPLTPSGKIDRRALPAPPAASAEAAGEAPRGETERTLAAIWSDVLGVDAVTRQDRFFQLGGDSIVALRVVFRAREAGLALTPRQIFQHPTLAELAAVAERGDREAVPQGPVAGEMPLTPVIHWFLDRDLPAPEHWNQAVMLRPVRAWTRADGDRLRRVAARLLAHHDALRLRLRREARGWRLENAGLDAVDPGGDVPAAEVDLRGLAGDPRPVLEIAAARVQASLRLDRGPLVRLVAFALPRGEARLLIVAHHLVTDGVSWRILLEDLGALWTDDAGGEAPLPPKTSSYRDFARRLAEHAEAGGARAELGLWRRQVEAETASLLALARDGADPAANLEATAERTVLELDAETTRRLVRELPEDAGVRLEDLLLAALARTIAGATGVPRVRVDLESHGREERDGLDLSRTVGFFTSVHPLTFDLRGREGPAAALAVVLERRRAVPELGVGWGVLRYLDPDPVIRGELAATPPSEVLFNYLGILDQALPAGAPFTAAEESPGGLRGPRGRRAHLLELNAAVADGRLRMTWSTSRAVHAPEVVAALAAGCRREVAALLEVDLAAVAAEAARPAEIDESLSAEDLETIFSQLEGNVTR